MKKIIKILVIASLIVAVTIKVRANETTNNNITNVLIMAIAALIGVAFNKFHFSSSALVLGLVLGEICESNLRRGILISKTFQGFFKSPITTVLLLVSFFMLLWPVVAPFIKKMRKKNK